MKKILICPGERATVAFLGQPLPLVNLPILGETLIGHWLEALVSGGTKEVLVLATDRPDRVRELVEGGVRWGIPVRVEAELQELSCSEAFAKYCLQDGWRELAADRDIILLDHLPGWPEHRLFTNYAQWFAAVKGWLPRALTPSRIGVREIRPGVWVGMRTHIAETAVLRGPCWIGDQVRVGPHAVIGPGAILESRVFIDAAVEVVESQVGPETFVGSLTKLENSLAWGNLLINWKTGSWTQVPDSFLLCSLAQRNGLSLGMERQGGRFSTFHPWLLKNLWNGNFFHGLKAKVWPW